jgi:tRNA-2-methylthio-N6-dimethylallyladenosine synthase
MESDGRKDGETHRVSGRAADNRLVHVALPAGLVELARAGGQDATDPRLAEGTPLPRPGDLLTVEVTHGAPHHLIADSASSGGRFEVRRTRSGDAWAQRERARAGLGGDEEHGHGHGGGAAVPGQPVLLGMPTLSTRA